MVKKLEWMEEAYKEAFELWRRGWQAELSRVAWVWAWALAASAGGVAVLLVACAGVCDVRLDAGVVFHGVAPSPSLNVPPPGPGTRQAIVVSYATAWLQMTSINSSGDGRHSGTNG